MYCASVSKQRKKSGEGPGQARCLSACGARGSSGGTPSSISRSIKSASSMAERNKCARAPPAPQGEGLRHAIAANWHLSLVPIHRLYIKTCVFNIVGGKERRVTWDVSFFHSPQNKMSSTKDREDASLADIK